MCPPLPSLKTSILFYFSFLEFFSCFLWLSHNHTRVEASWFSKFPTYPTSFFLVGLPSSSTRRITEPTCSQSLLDCRLELSFYSSVVQCSILSLSHYAADTVNKIQHKLMRMIYLTILIELNILFISVTPFSMKVNHCSLQQPTKLYPPNLKRLS